MATDFLNLNPLNRFSSRAALYQNRARYPHALLDYLRDTCGLKAEMAIADVGSGTGFLTALLLENGNRVFAVEPNAEMRAVAEASFADNPLFTSLVGTAEQLPINDSSVDMVTVGQALHWFEIDAAKSEFLRVLKPGGSMAVVDNRPRNEASELMQCLQVFQQHHFTDFGTAADPPERMVHLFEGVPMLKKLIPFEFDCGEAVFRDGFLSSSLAPEVGSHEYQMCKTGLLELFHQYEVKGKITLQLETVVYSGQL